MNHLKVLVMANIFVMLFEGFGEPPKAKMSNSPLTLID